MKFENYSIAVEIKNAIAKEGYKKPTDIQFKSIPPIIKGEDLLAIAQTGTGKTAAFAIPILHVLNQRKIDRRPDGVKCLVMAPTHELARQTEQVFKTLGKNLSLNTFCIHGGVDQGPQIAQLNKGVDILVATPGRVFDLESQGVLRLDRVEILVLDEADHMLALGFIKDIRQLMYKLPKYRQTLFFSATINEEIKDLAYSLVKNAIRIQISPKDPVSKNVKHSVAHIKMDDKRFFLENFINQHPDSKILVFVRTKVRAERVKKAMERVEIVTDTIHGDRTPDERKQVMRDFKGNNLKTLITTDVSARGIDIPNVDFVINYDLPDISETYVHRVGRTGRGKEKGEALTFCSEEEVKLLREIEANFPKPINELEIPEEDYQYTLDISENKANNWQSLLKQNEKEEQEYLAKKKKRRKKK